MKAAEERKEIDAASLFGKYQKIFDDYHLPHSMSVGCRIPTPEGISVEVEISPSFSRPLSTLPPHIDVKVQFVPTFLRIFEKNERPSIRRREKDPEGASYSSRAGDADEYDLKIYMDLADKVAKQLQTQRQKK